jgi:putative signal transducing protein
MHDSELIVVHSFGSEAEADLAQSALEAAGIEVFVRADAGGGQQVSIAWAGGGYEVVVRAEDVERAREVLELPAKPS